MVMNIWAILPDIDATVEIPVPLFKQGNGCADCDKGDNLFGKMAATATAILTWSRRRAGRSPVPIRC